jgi:hypothetical protein
VFHSKGRLLDLNCKYYTWPKMVVRDKHCNFFTLKSFGKHSHIFTLLSPFSQFSLAVIHLKLNKHIVSFLTNLASPGYLGVGVGVGRGRVKIMGYETGKVRLGVSNNC